jgi:hypothetical protein
MHKRLIISDKTFTSGTSRHRVQVVYPLPGEQFCEWKGDCSSSLTSERNKKSIDLNFRTNSRTNTQFSQQSAHYLHQSRRQSPPQNAKNLRKDSRTRDPIPAGLRFRLCAVLVFYVYYPLDIYF